jgi:hypothetical protein
LLVVVVALTEGRAIEITCDVICCSLSVYQLGSML